MRRKPLRLLTFVGFLLLDACGLAAAFEAAFQTRFNLSLFLQWFPVTKGYPDPAIYHQALLALLPVWIVIFTYIGAYKDFFIGAYDELVRVIKGVFFCSVLTMAMTFGYREAEYSRLVIALWCAYSVIFVYALREVAKLVVRRFEHLTASPQGTLIIGKGKMLDAIEKMMARQPFIKAQFLESLPQGDSLQTYVQKHRIGEVLLIQGGIAPQAVLGAASLCEQANIPCKIVPDMLELRRGEIVVDGFLGLPTFRLRPLSLHGMDYFLKRGFDVTLALFLLLFLFPFFLLIAVLIRLDSPGPIFHVQERMGFQMKPFTFYKFRTMVQNADQLLQELKARSDRSGPVFKMKSDPRITRVGRVLRKYSIDELPQIFNVLEGHMSFVGPRPQVLWEAAHYDETAKKRLRVKPGITGLWQVSGRAALSYEEMINLDLYYLENWSLGLDLKILLRTVPAIFAGQGAY